MKVGLLSSACVWRRFAIEIGRLRGVQNVVLEYSLIANSFKVKNGVHIRHVEPARARVGHSDDGK